MHNALREQVRLVECRSRDPSAALMDSPSVRGAETVGRSSRGFDAGKKSDGRNRHIVTDTGGLLLAVLITAAGVQDRGAGWAGQIGFVVLPRRWCVERTFSWINRCRRTVRDDERLPARHAAMAQWAMIIISWPATTQPDDSRTHPEAVIDQALRLVR